MSALLAGGRSFLRGLAAGVIVKVLYTACITLLLAGLMPTGGGAQDAAAASGGAFPILSGTWITAHALVFLGAVLAGMAAAHWSKRGSWAAPLALALVWLVWSALKIDTGQPLAVVAIRVAVSPVGILLGGLLHRSRFPAKQLN